MLGGEMNDPIISIRKLILKSSPSTDQCISHNLYPCLLKWRPKEPLHVIIKMYPYNSQTHFLTLYKPVLYKKAWSRPVKCTQCNGRTESWIQFKRFLLHHCKLKLHDWPGAALLWSVSLAKWKEVENNQ